MLEFTETRLTRLVYCVGLLHSYKRPVHTFVNLPHVVLIFWNRLDCLYMCVPHLTEITCPSGKFLKQISKPPDVCRLWTSLIRICKEGFFKGSIISVKPSKSPLPLRRILHFQQPSNCTRILCKLALAVSNKYHACKQVWYAHMNSPNNVLIIYNAPIDMALVWVNVSQVLAEHQICTYKQTRGVTDEIKLLFTICSVDLFSERSVQGLIRFKKREKWGFFFLKELTTPVHLKIIGLNANTMKLSPSWCW